MYLKILGRLNLLINWDKSFVLASITPFGAQNSPKSTQNQPSSTSASQRDSGTFGNSLTSSNNPQYGSSVEYMALMSKQSAARILNKTANFFLYSYYSEKEQYTVAVAGQDRFILFLQLLKIRQIGPKLAVQISEFFDSVEEFLNIVAQHDIDSLAKVPGLGKKKAALLVWHFSQADGKSFLESQQLLGADMNARIFQDIINTLVALGVKTRQAKDIVLAKKQILLDSINNGEKDIGKLVALILKDMKR